LKVTQPTKKFTSLHKALKERGGGPIRRDRGEKTIREKKPTSAKEKKIHTQKKLQEKREKEKEGNGVFPAQNSLKKGLGSGGKRKAGVEEGERQRTGKGSGGKRNFKGEKW